MLFETPARETLAVEVWVGGYVCETKVSLVSVVLAPVSPANTLEGDCRLSGPKEFERGCCSVDWLFRAELITELLALVAKREPFSLVRLLLRCKSSLVRNLAGRGGNSAAFASVPLSDRSTSDDGKVVS